MKPFDRKTLLFYAVFALCGSLWAAAQEAAPAAESSAGVIDGGVYDAANGLPIAGVTVEVAGETEFRTTTTTNGTFRISVPPGTYQMRFSSPDYHMSELEGMTVIAGQVLEANTVMASLEAVTTVDVVEQVAPVATADVMVMERRLAPVVIDAISGGEISAGTASDAAGGLKKVTGVSVVNNQYVYVRGLGERYSATRLNNSLLATTEPERRVVPLDMFPANLIDNIMIRKSYTPDLPGEFSGGLVEIRTIEFPLQPTLQFSQSVSFNTQTTFKEFIGYPGGGRDFFGFDDGSRDLPAAIPGDQRLQRGRFSLDEMQSFGRALSTNWEPVINNSARPSLSSSIVAGNTFGRLGLVAALNLSNKLQTLPETRNFLVVGAGGAPRPFHTYQYDSSTTSVKLGATLNAAYQINPGHKILVRNFLSRDTDDEARIFEGYNADFGTVIQDTRLRWVERSLYSGQVEGEHLMERLGHGILNWQMSFSRALRDEPDLRENFYLQGSDGQFRFRGDSGNGLRMWNDLNDKIYEPAINWRQPFYAGAITGLYKVGFSYSFRTRDFFSRRLRMFPVRLRGIDVALPANQLLAPENIRPDGFEIREETRVTDRYDAEHRIAATYAMVDLAVGPRWRFALGARIERSTQEVLTFNPFDPTRNRQQSLLENTDPLPAVNAIYALTGGTNLRFGYSQTISRPDFRELAPFDFTDVIGGRTVLGNPDLLRAKIHNFDGRWEWFPGGNQLVAASFFFKQFDDPIEQIVQPTVGLRTTFGNAESARNYGIELEFRRNLGFANPLLSELSMSSNFTYVNSRITLTPEQSVIQTSQQRALAGQSPYVFNVATDWNRPRWRSNVRLELNVVDRRISDVGTFGLPDIFEERNLTLDAVYKFSVREDDSWVIQFGAENLTDHTYRWTQGGELFQQFNRGRTFSIGTSFQFL